MSEDDGNAGRVLMVVSAVSRIPGSDARTGFFLEELTHPYLAVHGAGFAIDIATVPGGPAPIDPHSDPRQPPGLSKVHDDIVSMGFVNSPQHVSKLERTLKLADVDLAAYDAIFFAGGAGAIFDFPGEPSVERAIRRMWETGRIVSTVCHGGSALLDARLSDGSPLVRGLEVTGLSAAEEAAIHAAEPAFVTPRLMETEFPRLGAIYRKAQPNEPMVVTSGGGRLVTGQNPASGTAVGEALVAALRARRASPVPAARTGGKSVKVVAIDELAPGVTRDRAVPLDRAEAEHAWALMKAGIIRENYLRADGRGAVSVLECEGVDEASRIMNEFPLAKAGIVRFTFYELRPFTVLEALFGGGGDS